MGARLVLAILWVWTRVWTRVSIITCQTGYVRALMSPGLTRPPTPQPCGSLAGSAVLPFPDVVWSDSQRGLSDSLQSLTCVEGSSVPLRARSPSAERPSPVWTERSVSTRQRCKGASVAPGFRAVTEAAGDLTPGRPLRLRVPTSASQQLVTNRVWKGPAFKSCHVLRCGLRASP